MGGRPVASVLTNDMHERAAYEARREYGTPVWAPAAGVPDYEGRPDHLFEDGATLPGGLRAVKVEGPFPGDTALRWQAPDGTRVLFTGDMVLGAADPEDPRTDRPRSAPGLYLHGVSSHPRGSQDMAAFKASLRRLLDEDFDLVCPAHGVPYRGHAREALASLLG
jgi:glyoxylase-like metal-dependent hydrolase (beta-lactamase superfamily II)